MNKFRLSGQSDSINTTTTASFSFPILLGCFFLSGFAGLIYETAWTQQFTLVFGTSELAVATVLGAYMAGLALGAAIAARYSNSIRRPLWLYAVLELGICVTALMVPWAIRVAGKLQVNLFSGPNLPNDETGLSLLLFDLISSFGILLVPTCLMGATLPFLVRYAVRRERDVAPRVGMLYTLNTLGAAVGTLAAAFVFLPRFGQNTTVWVAVFTNLAVFLGAFLLARNERNQELDILTENNEHQAYTWVLPVMLVSGAISFTYEILWSRLLTHLLGGSIYAFGTMLATFLASIALGAAFAGRMATTRARTILIFALAQICAAFLSLGGFAVANRLPQLLPTLANQDSLFWMGTLLSSLTILPGALCFGATFPCAVKLLAGGAANAGRASGRVFSWNTMGAIFGSLFAGFYLIPTWGFAGTVKLAVICSLGLAMVITLLWRFSFTKSTSSTDEGFPWNVSFISLLVLIFTGSVVWYLRPPQTPWRILQTSSLRGNTSDAKVVFLGVGRSSTVMLTEYGSDWRLTTNGLPESVIQAPGTRPSRFSVARWLSLLPLAARPDTHSMMVIGLGGGVTVEQIPNTVKRIQVVELEPEVLRANRHLSAHRRTDALQDPRISIHINDARNALQLSNEKFDAIVSQPSHPWTGASSNLFTTEFFELVRARLNDSGVFVQWIGLQFVDADLLRSLVATLSESFSYVELYAPDKRRAVLFLASNRPLGDLAAMKLSLSNAKHSWAEVGIYRVEDILASRELDSQGSLMFAAGAPVISDGRNLLKIRSPRVLSQPINLALVDAIFGTWDPLNQTTDGMDRVYMARRLLERKQVVRARRVAAATHDPLARQTIEGMIAIAENHIKKGVQILTDVLRRDPGHAEAVATIIQLFRSNRRGQPTVTLNPLLSEHARALIHVWQLERENEWEQLRSMDSSLLIEDPSHPLYDDCLSVRVSWRLEFDDPVLIQQSLALSEKLVQQRALAPSFILRARAASKAENYPIMLAMLFEMIQYLERYPASQSPVLKEHLAHEVRQLIDTMPAGHPLVEHYRLKMLVQLAEVGSKVQRQDES